MLIQWKLLSIFLFTISLVEVCFATMVCTDFDVNLVDENPAKRTVQTLSGCVEVCYNDEYRGLCNPSWDEEEAIVVCRQLGFNSVLDYDECSLSGSGLGTGDAFPLDIDCTGTESDLSGCSTSNHTEPCSYTAVTCTRSVEFQLTRREYSACEFEDVEVCVEIVRGETVEDVVVELESHYYTATVGLDYEDLDEFLTFPANSTVGDEQCVTVSIIDDDLVEYEEYFSISATGIGGMTQDAEFLLWHDYAEVYIVDDDLLEIGFANASYTVDEGHGHIQACVEILSLEEEELERAVVFRITSSDGTAIDGDDYTSTSLLLAFHIGSSVGTQQCGDFDLEDDSDQEDEETFTVELTVTDLAVLIASGRESTTMHITDDDEFQIRFIEDTPYVSGGTVTINFEGNFPIESAHCQLALHPNIANLWVNCTSGTAEFEITQIRGRRRYPIYVNATSTDGQLTYLEREVRRENSHCSAHLINDGVTVNVTEVTVEWQGTGPSVAGNATVRADIFECQFPDISPTQFSCTSPYTFTADVGDGLLLIQANDQANTCSLNPGVILEVPFEVVGY